MTSACALPPRQTMPKAPQKNVPRPPFASWLREARLRRGITQEDMEAATGIDQGTISKYERGVLLPPKPDTVMALAKALSPESADEDAAQRLYHEGLEFAFGIVAEITAELDPDLQMIVENWEGMTPTGRRALKSAAELALEMSREGSIGKRAE